MRFRAAVVHRPAHQAMFGFQRDLPLHPSGRLLVVQQCVPFDHQLVDAERGLYGTDVRVR